MNSVSRIFETRPVSISVRVAKKSLVPWRTFSIGGGTKDELLKDVRRARHIENQAEAMMRHPDFAVRDEVTEMPTIFLTPEHFNPNESLPIWQLFDPRFLAAWSRENLEDEDFILQPLPREMAPRASLEYTDQPDREELAVAMKPVINSDGCPYGFSLKTLGTGERWLASYRAYPANRFGLRQPILFGLSPVFRIH